MNPWGTAIAVYSRLLNRGLTRLVVAVVVAGEAISLSDLPGHRVLCGLLPMSTLAPRPVSREPDRIPVIREDGHAVVVPNGDERNGPRLAAAEREGRFAGELLFWKSEGSVGLMGPTARWAAYDTQFRATTAPGVVGPPLTPAEEVEALDSFRAGLGQGGAGLGPRWTTRTLHRAWLVHDILLGLAVLMTFVLPAAQGLLWFARRARGNARRELGLCPSCGYDMRGQATQSRVCPECGEGTERWRKRVEGG